MYPLLSLSYRNPIHSKRPAFSEISTILNQSNNALLEWAREECPQAGDLGGELSESKNLYEDLQNTYLLK